MPTSEQGINTIVDPLADQFWTEYRQHQQHEKRTKEQQEHARDQQAIALLQALLATEFEASLLTALSPTYEVRRDSYGTPQTEAIFLYAGAEWHLSQEYCRGSEQWKWSIRAFSQRDGYHQAHLSDLSTTVQPLLLRTMLLVKLGERRAQVQRQQEEAREKERQQLVIAQQEAALAQQQEAERAERQKHADAEDQRLRALLAERRAQMLDSLWQWPEQTTISLYRITYTIGVGRDEEGTAVIEQEQGWTSTDQPDHDGYIRLEPQRCWSGYSSAREIKLDQARHLPVWERLHVRSVGELPEQLREDITLRLPRVVLRRDPTVDAVDRLVHLDTMDSLYEEELYEEQLGAIPAPWIRALVQHAAAQASAQL